MKKNKKCKAETESQKPILILARKQGKPKVESESFILFSVKAKSWSCTNSDENNNISS